MIRACRLVLSAIWLVAAAGKLSAPLQFMAAVSGFRLAPGFLVPWIAALMPGVELVVGLVLLGAALRPPERGRSRGSWAALADGAAWVAAAMLAMFTGAIAVDLLRGIEMNCGCFDLLGKYLGEAVPFLKAKRAGWDTVARDVVMLLPALWLLAHPALPGSAGRRR